MLHLEIFWISKSFSHSLAIGQFPSQWMKPCKSADYFIPRFQLGKFFVVIKNISVWIWKNMATEIYPLTESCSGACFIIIIIIILMFTFYLFNRYRIGHSR